MFRNVLEIESQGTWINSKVELYPNDLRRVTESEKTITQRKTRVDSLEIDLDTDYHFRFVSSSEETSRAIPTGNVEIRNRRRLTKNTPKIKYELTIVKSSSQNEPLYEIEMEIKDKDVLDEILSGIVANVISVAVSGESNTVILKKVSRFINKPRNIYEKDFSSIPKYRMTNKLDGERCLLYGTRNGSVICKSPFKSNTLVPSSSKFDGLTILDGEWLEKTQTVLGFRLLIL